MLYKIGWRISRLNGKYILFVIEQTNKFLIHIYLKEKTTFYHVSLTFWRHNWWKKVIGSAITGSGPLFG